MLRGPRQPSAPGDQFEHTRRTALHARQYQNVGAFSGKGDLTTHGYIERPVRQIVQGGTTEEATPRPIGLTPRGEWSADVEYQINDLVVVYGVGNAGLWFATDAAAAGSVAPGGAGGVWVQLAPGFVPAVWG